MNLNDAQKLADAYQALLANEVAFRALGVTMPITKQINIAKAILNLRAEGVELPRPPTTVDKYYWERTNTPYKGEGRFSCNSFLPSDLNDELKKCPRISDNEYGLRVPVELAKKIVDHWTAKYTNPRERYWIEP